jgi:hypothetical protein
MSFIIDAFNSRLPTQSLLFGDQPILNIQSSQYGYIQGKPGVAYNRSTKKPFYIPEKKNFPGVFDISSTTDNVIQWQAAQYQSKVAKNAVEALHAIESAKAQQAYFDELDKNNLFPRAGRSVNLSNSVQSQTNSDGSTTIYHQPGWLRVQQNQFIGDSTQNVNVPSNGPTNPNPSTANTILGSNKVMTKTNESETMTEEFGRIGKTSGIAMGTDTPSFDVPKHRVRDLRTVESNTNIPDIDATTLDLIFSNGSKFQTFIDKLKFGNETLQSQLSSQNSQLGAMSQATMKTFRDILTSVGFDAKSLPSTISPDDIQNLLAKVDTLSPVALTEIGAMNRTIEALRAQKSAEMSDVGTQYQFQEKPEVPEVPFIYPDSIKSRKSYSSKSPTSEMNMFSDSPGKQKYSHSRAKSAPPETEIPLQPQFNPEQQPSPVIIEQATASIYPTLDDIFGTDPVQMASDPLLRRSTRNRKAPEILSYDNDFKQTSSRKRRG